MKKMKNLKFKILDNIDIVIAAAVYVLLNISFVAFLSAKNVPASEFSNTLATLFIFQIMVGFILGPVGNLVFRDVFSYIELPEPVKFIIHTVLSLTVPFVMSAVFVYCAVFM